MDTGVTIFVKTVRPALEAARAEWLARARARALWLGRGGKLVCVDDVRPYCRVPEGCDPRVYGAVFKGQDWVRVGDVNSQRRECHGRRVSWFIRADFAQK